MRYHWILWRGENATGFPTTLFDLTNQRERRTHDHRIKAQIIAAGDPTLFAGLQMLTAVLRLVLALLRSSGFKLEQTRVADAEAKCRLLSAIERARRVMQLTAALRVFGLSAARNHDWVGRQQGYSLDDDPSCPRSNPQCLTFEEVEAIGDLVQSKDHRHMSIRALAFHDQRIGRVFAHPQLGPG